MNLFLDTASTDCWADLAGTGLFSGITTNPLLVQRAGMKTSIDTYQTLYDRAMKLGYPNIQFLVFGEDWLRCAQSIASIGPQVFIKIPANKKGFEVVSELSLPDRTTLTAVYSDGQIIAAEALQVAYTAPYYARLKDAIEMQMSYLIGCRILRLKPNSWLRACDRMSSSSIWQHAVFNLRASGTDC